MRIQDQFIVALAMWRENRCGGLAGMQSVGNVILNRAAKHATTPWTVATAWEQFSSISAAGDPELTLWPSDGDARWEQALELAARAAAGALEDITGGALLYYAPHALRGSEKTYVLPDGAVVPFPRAWNPLVVRYLGEIAGQLFFTE